MRISLCSPPNPSANNVVYNFDVTTDRLDLIGFAGVTSMANATGNDADGNAVISIGEGQSITIKGRMGRCFRRGELRVQRRSGDPQQR